MVLRDGEKAMLPFRACHKRLSSLAIAMLNGISKRSCATDRRKDKALTAMPSRKFACREAIRLPDEQREELCKAKSQEAERDKSGHRRKASLLSAAH